jgi:hypothetical protein
MEFKDRKDLTRHIWGGGTVLTEHDSLEIARTLSKMIAEKQEPSIPISKIEELIKQLESSGLLGSTQSNVNTIGILKSLLPKK